MWQTTLDVFSDFPRRCQSFWDMNKHTPRAYDDQEAFYCDYFNYHRIIEEECLGEGCPCCRLVGMDDYLRCLR